MRYFGASAGAAAGAAVESAAGFFIFLLMCFL